MTQVGSRGNLWNAAVTGAAGVSAAIQLPGCRVATVSGSTSGATTFTVQFSMDGINWNDSGVTNAPAGAGDVGFSFDVAAPWVRIKSLNSVTATLSLAGS